MCPGGAGGAPKNSVTISTLPFNVMLLFVATFDMAHETVRSEALSDKLRSAARRLPPGLLDPGEACAQKAARGTSNSDAAAHRARGSAADASFSFGKRK